MKQFIFLLGMLFLAVSCFSQNRVEFGYDLAGNRVSRTIIMTLSFASQNPQQQEEEEEEEPAIYTDVLAEAQIDIYPNPTEGLLRVDIRNLPEGKKADVVLFNLSGKKIISKQTDFSTEIDITDQPTGVYILKIIVGEEQTDWKIIKK